MSPITARRYPDVYRRQCTPRAWSSLISPWQTKKAAGYPAATQGRARKVQALPRLQKDRPVRGPALAMFYLISTCAAESRRSGCPTREAARPQAEGWQDHRSTECLQMAE